MRITRLIALAAAALIPVAAGAATFIVPAAGTGPGLNNSHWQSELTLHSSSSTPMTVTLTFHVEQGAAETSSLQLAPRATVSIEDIVATHFERLAATGAIEITVPDEFAKKLAVSSRTVNVSDDGVFGQDIPSVKLADAVTAGRSVVLAAPSDVATTRFNAGLYAPIASSVRWELLRADGTVATSAVEEYAAGSQRQHNDFVRAFMKADPADNDVIVATVQKGSIIAYGSAINNESGDPNFVAPVETTTDIRVQFLGIDSDLDNQVNIADADHDGVLDAPVSIYATFPWPTSFRIMVNGSNPTFELAAPNPDVTLSKDGYVIWKATPSGGPNTGTLLVRIFVGNDVDVITIPVRFQ